MASYLFFKFIVPADKVEEVKKLLKSDEIIARPSKKGNFISLTCSKNINNSDEIIILYRKASQIKGVITL